MGERFVIDGERLAMVREESLQALPQSRQRHIKRMEPEINESQPQMCAMRQLGRSEGAAFKSAAETGVGCGDSFHGEEKAPARTEPERAPFGIRLTNYFLTISAFSSIETPPLVAILPFKVTVLPASGASSSFIGLCAPTTR